MNKLILLSNDDGINAPGLQFLVSFLKDFGKIVVVAPDSAMSGMGHAVTIQNPLRLKKHQTVDGVERYSINGTPADCVKIAVDEILCQKPDLVIGGINHGSNSSVNVIYSGTMAVAIEGAMQNISSIGFSAVNYDVNYDMSHFEPWIKKIVANTIENPLPQWTCLNVNFPNSTEIAGIKVGRQAIARWKEEFDKRTDVHNTPYYWLKGNFILDDEKNDCDEKILENKFISIVPTHIDLTDYSYIDKLSKQLK